MDHSILDEPSGEAPILEQDEKTIALLSHIGTVVGAVIPFGNMILPLILWLVYKDRSIFVGEHSKESLNFQITMSIIYIICTIFMIIFIGFLMIGAAIIVALIFTIIATIKASEGEYYKYPLAIRFIK